MAKNAGESRIPLPRTVRPSLLPKIRSLGPAKIGSPGHRRSPVYCTAANNKQQQQQFGKTTSSNIDNTAKQVLQQQQQIPKKISCTTPDTDKDYSISTIWSTTTDNKEADHLMRLNDESKLGILRSQEDLANFACFKQKQKSHEDVNSGLEANNIIHGNSNSGINEFGIESPVSTAPHYLMLTKQNSFEHDESLGILTPDQMTDFTVALESSRTPSCENLSDHANQGKFFLGKNNSSTVVSAAARHLDIAACVPSIETLLPTNDRSPSLEELPLDPVVIIDEDVNLLEETLCSGENIPTLEPLEQPTDTAEFSSSSKTIESTETSEHISEQTRCVVSGSHVLPTSFITSVTSITSLEAGYQGDGENSRPASRGPEPLSIAPAANLIVGAPCRQDPMTDSDFFTESDADAHEEIVRGDRRAQVIDGTLFCAPNERRCPSFEPGEEMDSSGIYSDLDKRQDSEHLMDAEGYADGDHTTDTGDTEISMRSQPSPQDKMPMSALVTNNVLSPQEFLNDTIESNCTSSTGEVTVIKCQKNEQNTATKSKSNSISNKENSAPLKKYKMPKKNVISKIKTMIESNQNIAAKDETENEPRRLQRQQRKNGRWDAVMNKIEAGKQRGRSLRKEVKSRVLQGLGTSTSSTASTSSTRRPAGDANNNANNNNKDKRRTRGRPETNLPNQETARSSVRSSASDLSSANSKEALKRPSRKNCIDAHQPNNNQLNTNLIKSNLSAVNRKAPSIKSVQSNVNTKKKNATTNNVSDRNVSNSRSQISKDNSNNTTSNGQLLNNHLTTTTTTTTTTNNNNLVVVVSESTTATSTPTAPIVAEIQKVETKEVEIQADLISKVFEEVSRNRRKDDENAVQALAVTVQYLVHQLDDVSNRQIRNDLEKMKTEWISTRNELEDLRLRKDNIEDVLNQERAEHIQAVDSLREDLEREQAERSSLEELINEERRRVNTLQDLLQEREREQRANLERLIAEHELELSQARALQVVQDQGALLAEVESLRTVLELRSQENAQLRSEVDLLKRELDDKETIKLKCESLEARCEDLKAQLDSKENVERQLVHEKEVLMGSLHQMSKQNKRFQQRIEELQWRLRQKSEVVSVLTNQLTPPSQRLSKSLGPEHPEHPSLDSNCSTKSENCSMVKYMTEKADSVSWTLHISESSNDSNNSRRYHDNNGTLASRQSSLRLSMPRRTNLTTPSRMRSNSVSVAESSARAAAAAAAAEESSWSPTYNSTPLQNRRRNVVANEQSRSLSNTVTETTLSSSCSSSVGVGSSGIATSTKVVALEVSTTDEDDEEEEEEDEAQGQRPQEAGGEAMISEETSASSSSEDDESSVSSSDIP